MWSETTEVSTYCPTFREESINGHNYPFRHKRKHGLAKFGVTIYGAEDVASVNLGRKRNHDNNSSEVTVN